MTLYNKINSRIRDTIKSIRKAVAGRLIKFGSVETCLPPLERYDHPVETRRVDTPEAVNMPFIRSALHFKHETYTPPPLVTGILKNVIYETGRNNVLSNDKKLLQESVNTVKSLTDVSLVDLYLAPKKTLGGYTTVFRSTSNEYYHVLIDNIPRLYPLHFSPYNGIDEIKLVVPGSLTPTEKFFLDRTLPPNVTVSLVARNRHYKLDTFIYLPFMTPQYAGYLPPQYVAFFIDKVAPRRPRRQCRRIYISRADCDKRRILNEHELVAVLRPLGFESYKLEGLSIEDQIELFYDAEAVVGAHGAGLSNLIYASNIPVLELFPQERIKPSYYFLSKSVNHTYRYLSGSVPNPMPTRQPMNQDFLMDVERVSALLKAML